MAAVPEADLDRIRQFCESKSPENLSDKARVEAGARGKSVTIFECHAPWHPEMPEWSRNPSAQLRYDADAGTWSLYWADRNSRWHPYDLIEPGTVDELLAEIADDPTCIFWG